jgi:hypothetical protein
VTQVAPFLLYRKFVHYFPNSMAQTVAITCRFEYHVVASGRKWVKVEHRDALNPVDIYVSW